MGGRIQITPSKSAKVVAPLGKLNVWGDPDIREQGVLIGEVPELLLNDGRGKTDRPCDRFWNGDVPTGTMVPVGFHPTKIEQSTK